MSQFRILEIDQLLSEYCHVTSNPRRSLLIRILGDGERTVSELVELTGFSAANISQHLRLLRQKRIVAVQRDGAYSRYRLIAPKLLQAMALMREAFMECLDGEQRMFLMAQEDSRHE